MFSKNFSFKNEFIEIYEDATSQNNGYGYFLLDLNQTTRQRIRIQTNIIPCDTQPRIFYTFKDTDFTKDN